MSHDDVREIAPVWEGVRRNSAHPVTCAQPTRYPAPKMVMRWMCDSLAARRLLIFIS